MAAASAGGSPPLAHLAALNLPGLLAGTDTNGNSGSRTLIFLIEENLVDSLLTISF